MFVKMSLSRRAFRSREVKCNNKRGKKKKRKARNLVRPESPGPSQYLAQLQVFPEGLLPKQAERRPVSIHGTILYMSLHSIIAVYESFYCAAQTPPWCRSHPTANQEILLTGADVFVAGQRRKRRRAELDRGCRSSCFFVRFCERASSIILIWLTWNDSATMTSQQPREMVVAYAIGG